VIMFTIWQWLYVALWRIIAYVIDLLELLRLEVL